MKRDMDLIRKLLIHFEETLTTTENIYSSRIEIDGYMPEEITYNVKVMWKSGLIEVIDCSAARDFFVGYIEDITPLGHDLLSSIRNDGVWNKVKEQTKPLGDVSFDVLKAVAGAVALKFLGI